MNLLDQSPECNVAREAGSEPAGEIAGKAVFIALNGLFGCLFFRDLLDLAVTAYRSNYYSYILFIPFISGYLMYLDRRRIFPERRNAPVEGIAIVAVGVLLLLGTRSLRADLDHIDDLAVRASALITIWIGIFTGCHGFRSLKAALFPALFLFLIVPVPNTVREGFISFLQTGSTEAAQALFSLLGVPATRDGFLFYFPDLTIEVAKQCSGIRSGLALIITGLLAAKLFLKGNGTRIILIAAILPVAMAKNGLRIATLSLLALYWDRKILDSDLHHKGGILFFILAVIVLGGLLAMLRKYENRHGQAEPKG